MRKTHFIYFLVLVTLLFPPNAMAQSDFSFAAGGGVMFYNGDLSDSRVLPPPDLLHGYYCLDASVLLIDRIDLSLRYLHGKIEGDDALSNQSDNRIRNQSFFSPIDEVNLMARARLFKVKSRIPVNPYLMIGIGYLWFNPKAVLEGKIYELQPLGTEGQFIEGGNYPAPYSRTTASLAGGLGIFVPFSSQFAIRIEGAPQLTFTDYLDDVSSMYPDSAALSHTHNGAIAVLLANRRTRGGFPPQGHNRGNPYKNDVVITVGLSLVYTPARLSSPHGGKMGVFHQIFKGKKGWWGLTPN